MTRWTSIGSSDSHSSLFPTTYNGIHYYETKYKTSCKTQNKHSNKICVGKVNRSVDITHGAPLIRSRYAENAYKNVNYITNVLHTRVQL